MFEESSKQGCLNSSYLLWESNQKAAVSSIFFSQNSFFIVASRSVMCNECTQKEIAVPQNLPPS